MRNFIRSLNAIGAELVRCSRRCDGVRCDRRTGHLPRCLYLDVTGRHGLRGSVVVGVNPGRSTASERRYYRERDCTFGAVGTWFTELGTHYPYYVYLRRLVDRFGLKGPIVWTELAKCENRRGVTNLPLQTFRTCTDAFLQRELEACPKEWPLVAVGTEAYKGLAYRFPTRTVIGVPHPTGSRGHFHALFQDGKLRKRVAVGARKALRSDGSAVWLGTRDVA